MSQVLQLEKSIDGQKFGRFNLNLLIGMKLPLRPDSADNQRGQFIWHCNYRVMQKRPID